MERKTLVRLARISTRTSVLTATAVLTACAQQPMEYSWSHLESGEYLFAYDVRACEETAQQELMRMQAGSRSAKASSQFFDCMQGLGYYLVDPRTGSPLTASIDPLTPGTSNSQAAAD